MFLEKKKTQDHLELLKKRFRLEGEVEDNY